MTAILKWAALGAAVTVSAGCNDIGSGYYLLGSCGHASSFQCTEIRINQNIKGPDRLSLQQAEETSCGLDSGVYIPDRECSHTATAQGVCVMVEDEHLLGTDITFTRNHLYLAGYDSADDFQTETDDCEAAGGEFRDAGYVPPGSG